MKMPLLFACVIAGTLFRGTFLCGTLRAQEPEPAAIPHGQKSPPGPALSPAEAMAKMTVPEGFSVELVASEPDIVNPVAMTFDERGRIWITESLEYPRREAGPGRDRVKVLEDTDGDGKADRFSIFADGLNIPSGIAVGHGGVWVANSPDILFLKDTDGDGKADQREVVVTGFGRDDTHELPNSLTWGPDGWLYGLNGVFNASRVEHQGRTHEFTCALFRIHPRTREFELFAQGTSNPWGVAFDDEGSAFVSACVIDHLWHLSETAYYQRQGGPYPPFTWPSGSIVNQKHQQAAYCGIHYFDSDAYPEEYRKRLYMGNIHGNCINVDVLKRQGSSYQAESAPDFLSANDAWFMPVVQKTGPDGCLYILDWYDRYHCYQDANRDPEGIDRLKGRLYRVRYLDTLRRWNFDLAALDDKKLIERLGSANVYDRDIAQRLLAERAGPATLARLEKLVLDPRRPKVQRMHGLWSRIGAGPLGADFHLAILNHTEPGLRAWAVRAAGNMRRVKKPVLERFRELVDDPSPEVAVQLAVAACKLEGWATARQSEPAARAQALVNILFRAGEDDLIPHVVWQNLHPLLETENRVLFAELARPHSEPLPWLGEMAPRLIDRILGGKTVETDTVSSLYQALVEGPNAQPQLAEMFFDSIAKRVQNGELTDGRLEAVRSALREPLAAILDGESTSPLYLEAAFLATAWKDEQGQEVVRLAFASPQVDDARRLRALEALIAGDDSSTVAQVASVLGDVQLGSSAFRGEVLNTLGRLDDPRVAEIVLSAWPTLEPELRPKAIELLTGRAEWARQLMAAIERKEVPPEALNLNQVRKLLATGEQDLKTAVETHWGTIRTDRNADREQVIARARRLIRKSLGDPRAGQIVYKKVCGQCHKLYGEGLEVGPDITLNGRSSFEQLLSNVFDPSLVIGAAYRAQTLITTDGRVISGLLVEDSPERVVLKVQGGKLESVARSDVDEMAQSPLSLMPEDLEKQIPENEMVDLFAYLILDRPPDDPQAQRLPGVAVPLARESSNPADFDELVQEVAPGFQVRASGEGGVALLAEHAGREGVLRTHPVSRSEPCVLKRSVNVPAGMITSLLIDVSHHEKGDWRLVVTASGETVYDEPVSAKSAPDGWLTASIDLTSFAGQTVELVLSNAATGWAWEFAYWGRVEIVSQP